MSPASTASGGAPKMADRQISLRDGMFKVGLNELGDGPPLLYLHGIWDGPDNPLLGLLAKHHRVLVPDIPGFGATRGEEHLFDVHDALYFFLDLLDHLRLDGLPIVGHCLGGMFAAELAAAQPERFSGVALLAPFGMWSDLHPALDLFAASPPELAAALYGSSGPDGIAGEMPLRPGSTEPAQLSDEERVERALQRARALAGAARFLWPIPDRGLQRRAHRLPSETLLVWGEQDSVVPLAQAELFRRAVPTARLEIVEGAAHLLHYQKPEEVATLLQSALGAQAASRAG